MPDSPDLLPDLKRALQSMRSAVQMLRAPHADPAAVAFVCAAAHARLEEAVQVLERERPRRRRVLIVDPERSWAEALAESLRLDGHHADTTATSTDALAACSALRPDVVLVDIGMAGHGAARNLRSISDTAVLVALSGWSREDDRRLAKEAGFDHFLQKPVSPVAVARLVATLPPV